jgi:hypothetical protein
MVLFFGCRQSTKDLVYKRELDEAQANGVMDVHVALSREPGKPKVTTLVANKPLITAIIPISTALHTIPFIFRIFNVIIG